MPRVPARWNRFVGVTRGASCTSIQMEVVFDEDGPHNRFNLRAACNGVFRFRRCKKRIGSIHRATIIVHGRKGNRKSELRSRDGFSGQTRNSTVQGGRGRTSGTNCSCHLTDKGSERRTQLLFGDVHRTMECTRFQQRWEYEQINVGALLDIQGHTKRLCPPFTRR